MQHLAVRRLPLSFVLLSLAGACSEPPAPKAAAPHSEAPAQPPAPPAPAAPVAPAAPKAPNEMTVVDIALGSPDHTTLVAAIKAADLVVSLSSPGGVYTVFAPTNAAFGKLPPGTVEGLLKPEKKGDLKSILQHHAMVPVLTTADLKDGQVLSMADGKKVKVKSAGGKVSVDGANIVASVRGMNGIVHVVDAVLVPAAQ